MNARQVLKIATVMVGALGVAGAACDQGQAGANPESAAGTEERASVRAASAAGDVLGTISARFDGEERTWYVVAGEMEGGRQSSAIWTSADHERMATVAGFDTPDVPLETFRTDFEAGELSYGDYEGSVLTIGFHFGPEDSDLLARLPEGDGAVIYLPRVQGDDVDFSGMYSLEEGTLEVDLLDARPDGPSEFGGTFEGTLVRLDQADSIRVTDGRFEVAGAAYMESEETGDRSPGR